MRRILCSMFGHRWIKLRCNIRKAINLGHLHPLAGYEAKCERCGEHWDDLWSPFFDDVFDPHPSPLPTATLRK